MTLENVQQTAATSLLSDIESKPSQAAQDIGDFDEVVNHPSNLSTLEHEIRGDYAPASEASASLALDNVQRETTASTQQFVTTSNSPQDPKDATRSQTILEAIQYRRELLKLTRDIRMATEEQLAMMDSVGGRQIAKRARGRLTKKKQSDDKESEMQEFQQLSSSLLGSNDEDRVEDVVSGLEGKRNLNVSGDDSTEMGEDKKRSTPEDHTREEVDFSLNDSIDGKPVDKRPDVGLYKADSGKWVSRTFACLILKVT